ncbi:hypothetical protein D3C71_1463270 [compost metagenome]
MIGLPSASLIQCAVGSSSGSPARNTYFSASRSWRRMKSASCFLSTRIAVGEENSVRTPYCSHSAHQMPGSGWVGSPSYSSEVQPPISGP